MKVRKLIETTEMREVTINRLVTREVIVLKKFWEPTTEQQEMKVQKWIETEVPCAGSQCRYPSAKHYAMGMCQHCYMSQRLKLQRLNGDTIEGLQAEFWAIPIGSRLPEGLWDRMKKLGIKNFDTGPKPKAIPDITE